MSPLFWRAVIPLVLGAALGSVMTARHYRTQLDTVQDQLGNAVAARDNLEALAEEQGLALGQLVQAGKDREQLTQLALQ